MNDGSMGAGGRPGCRLLSVGRIGARTVEYSLSVGLGRRRIGVKCALDDGLFLRCPSSYPRPDTEIKMAASVDLFQLNTNAGWL